MSISNELKCFYGPLYMYKFISSKGFTMVRFDEEGFDACAATLKDSNGCKITVSFNIHDEEPDECELVIQLHNRCSIEQLKSLAGKIAEDKGQRIDLYDEPDVISLVTYYDLTQKDEPIDMMKVLLDGINKNIFFLV